jgi:hypothetical protein
MNKESRREFGFMLGPGRFGSFGLDTRMTAFAAGFTAKAAQKGQMGSSLNLQGAGTTACIWFEYLLSVPPDSMAVLT